MLNERVTELYEKVPGLSDEVPGSSLRCNLSSDYGLVSHLSCLWLRLLQHQLTGASQFSQFDFGVLGSVQRHLAVLPGRVGGAFMRLTCCYLCEVADLSAQLALHPVDGALELAQLSVQQAGVVFVFGELQDDGSCALQNHRDLLLHLLQSPEPLVGHHRTGGNAESLRGALWEHGAQDGLWFTLDLLRLRGNPGSGSGLCLRKQRARLKDVITSRPGDAHRDSKDGGVGSWSVFDPDH